MSTFSDLLSKAQQLVTELEKFTQGELQNVKDLATEIAENLKHEVDKEVGAEAAPASTPEGEPAANAPGAEAAKANDTSGIQISSDING